MKRAELNMGKLLAIVIVSIAVLNFAVGAGALARGAGERARPPHLDALSDLPGELAVAASIEVSEQPRQGAVRAPGRRILAHAGPRAVGEEEASRQVVSRLRGLATVDVHIGLQPHAKKD